MNKEYSARLESLKARRFDQETDQSVLHDGFFNEEYPDAVKYALESMAPIDYQTSLKMFLAVRRTQNLIQEQLKKREILVDARYIGAHTTNTHIELYGDLSLFVILRSFEGKASEAVRDLNNEIMDVLTQSQAYNAVDNSDKRNILVKIRRPVCTLGIIPGIWINSSRYQKAHLEINRGVCEFNFEKKTRKVHLPFLNVARLNAQDKLLGGKISSIIRLLRTLKYDADQQVALSDDQINGMVHNFSSDELGVDDDKMLSLLPNISLEINRLLTDSNYASTIVSPGRSEYVFGKNIPTEALTHLKKELDELIEDIEQELRSSNRTMLSSIPY